MLRLVGVLLACGALCLASPVPTTRGRGCPAVTLIYETFRDVQTLSSKGSSKIPYLNIKLEGKGNITTYLERFIEALKSSKEGPEERIIAQKLQKIQADGKFCLKWMELKPIEDFFSNLESLLRFLKHNSPS